MFNLVEEEFIEYVKTHSPTTFQQMDNIIGNCDEVFDFYFDKGIFNDLVSVLMNCTCNMFFIKETIKYVFELCYAIAKSDDGIEAVKQFCDEHSMQQEFKEMYKYILKIQEIDANKGE